ncbi:circadian clock protein PASD1 isoform X3 [Oryctolagus cuniculus]|uniref:circadian clock protein PASD1 isoform X3 n=1 Tax=Oryctolagus cuniculus TaxID=9986 RepID=UPI0004904EC7|nr:circadian clock protein PASD1 isoform X3 [Oryctolagus cuniculus]
MDEGDRENENADVPGRPERRKKERIKSFFSELRAMMKSQGYPTKGDRYKAPMNDIAVSQLKGIIKSSWMPRFRNYEEFNQMTLQSLDAFMVILSTDGLIIYVSENISPLLGYLPEEIVGKKLLHLLHDEEKNEVYQKIALKLPMSNSVEKHIEFGCYLKRGDTEHDAYEYAKFILDVKDIALQSEPFALFAAHIPTSYYDAPTNSTLPWEDRIYLVGMICIIRNKILKELYDNRYFNREVLLTQDSEGEHAPWNTRSAQGQRRGSRFQTLRDKAAASNDETGLVAVQQYGSQEVEVIKIESDSSYDSKTSSDSPAQSWQSFGYESEVDPEKLKDPVDLEYSVSLEEAGDLDNSVDTENLNNTVETVAPEVKENSAGQSEPEYVDDSADSEIPVVQEVLSVDDSADSEIPVVQEVLSAATVFAGSSAQPVSLPMVSYTNGHELHLMKTFKEQLEDRTRVLQADITSKQDALDMMKEQLQTLQDSTYQMQSTTFVVSPESKTQCTAQMKRSFSDVQEAKRFCGPSRSLTSTNMFDDHTITSNQRYLQEQEQYLQGQLLLLQQQMQQLQEQKQQQLLQKQLLPEQSQHHSNAVGNHMMQLCLPSQTLPFYNKQVTYVQTRPFLVPLRIVTEQKSPDYYQDGDSKPQQNESSESDMDILETPQDFIKLWPQPAEPQHHVFFDMNPWTSNEQSNIQGQPMWHEVQVANPRTQQPPTAEASQAPAADPRSSPAVYQQKQYFRPKP